MESCAAIDGWEMMCVNRSVDLCQWLCHRPCGAHALRPVLVGQTIHAYSLCSQAPIGTVAPHLTSARTCDKTELTSCLIATVPQIWPSPPHPTPASRHVREPHLRARLYWCVPIVPLARAPRTEPSARSLVVPMACIPSASRTLPEGGHMVISNPVC